MQIKQSPKLQPPPEDRAYTFATDAVGMEIYSAHYRVDRIKTGALTLAGVLIVVLLFAVVTLARRPIQYRWVGIDPSGRAQLIAYNDLRLTLTEAMARTYLTNWLQYKFTVNRATFVTDYSKSYLFEDDALAKREMKADLDSHVAARVANGQIEQNDVIAELPEILSFDMRDVSGGQIAHGQALLNYQKVFLAGTSREPHKERWTSAVEFEINPLQVRDKVKKDPMYERFNLLGVTVLSHQETRRDDPLEEK